MANTYLYGAYGHVGETCARNATQAGTVPVYIGTTPVNLVRNYKDKGVINKPVKVANFLQAQQSFGLSSDWNNFTLSEVFNAHFNNQIGNIGPIYVINVLDPEEIKSEGQKTKSVTFTNGRAEFLSDTIILDTIAIEDKVEGIDFAIDYNYTRGSVVLTNKNTSDPLDGAVTISYYEIDLTRIDENTIIGGQTAAGEVSGLAAIKLLYQEQNQVANLIAAPKWSGIPKVYNAMIAASQKINGHWDAFCFADIPLTDAESNPIDTIQKAITWKKANGYASERAKVYWPAGKDNEGNVFHLSTLAMVETMRADFNHNSVPMETCGNKQVAIIAQYFGAESKNAGFDQQEGNDLTAAGISTAVYWGGNWNLWGDHTAAYSYGADVDARAIFDVSMRMLMHLTNSFQREWAPKIDKPMTMQLKERILVREQEKLDGYVAQGALIGAPTIVFLQSENSVVDLMNGDFRFDIQVTPTPPMKSATVYVAYSDAGFDAYFEKGE